MGIRTIVEGRNPSIDIIAVHGLNTLNRKEHADKTWTAPNGKMWLQDFLPDDIPNARIMLFEYNANIAFQTSSEGVAGQSEKLLDSLESKRQDAVSERPLIFIGYSLGGVIIKQALITSRMCSKGNPLKDIWRNTIGVVFFGTPHRGANDASLGAIVSSVVRFTLRNPGNPYIEAVKKNSAFRDQMVQNFRELLEDFYIYSFYETKPLKGHSKEVVEKHSAILELPRHRERTIGLDADHLSMPTFENREGDYDYVANGISKLFNMGLKARLTREKLGQLDLPLAHESLQHDPLNTMSYEERTDFVGREMELSTLSGLLSRSISQPRAALYGPAGSGKTAIAVQFCYDILKRERCHVFWTFAQSEESFEASFRHIAQLVPLEVNPDSSTEDICLKVKGWLESRGSGSWILVLDGMDKLELASRRYLPVRNGKMIITSKNERVLGDLVSTDSGIHISELSEANARQLFRTLVPNMPNLQDPEMLLQELDRNALAIRQAGAYIRHKHISISEYLYLMAHNAISKEEILEYQEQWSWNASERLSKAVMTTWVITFDFIQKSHPASLMLVQRMSLMNPSYIARNLVDQSQTPNAAKSFLETIGRLLEHSLVNTLRYDGYHIHSLVAFFTVTKMRREGNLSEVLQGTIQLLVPIIPKEDRGESVNSVLPHIAALSSYSKDANLRTSQLATLEHRLAAFLLEQGSFNRAEWHSIAAWEVRGETQTTYFDDFPEILDQLANVYRRKDNTSKMRKWLDLAIEASQIRYGPEHPITLRMLGHLATCYTDSGDYRKALKHYEELIAIRKRQDGPNSQDGPETLALINNFGNLQYLLNNYSEALTLHIRARNGNCKLPDRGPKHRITLQASICVVRDLGKLGRPAEAYPIMREVINEYEDNFADDESCIAMAYEDQAELCMNDGKYDESLRWYQKALAGYRRVGSHTGKLIGNMGEMLKRKGDFEGSLKYFNMSLAQKWKLEPPNEVSIMLTMRNIADLGETFHDYTMELYWYRKALDLSRKRFGNEHDLTIRHQYLIAGALGHQGRYKEGIELCESLLSLLEKTRANAKDGKAYKICSQRLDELYNQRDSFVDTEEINIKPLL